MDQQLKNRENNARRKLTRRLYLLRKSRAKHTNIDDYGGYRIVDATTNAVAAGERFDLSLEQVEDFIEWI